MTVVEVLVTGLGVAFGATFFITSTLFYFYSLSDREHKRQIELEKDHKKVVIHSDSKRVG